jgi:serine/threonine-protein kinase
MGVVYRARDLALDREVALKCPHPADASDPDRHRRFKREGRAAAGLSHPNIVQVYEVFEADGVPWIAMELVDGSSLRATLERDGPLPWERLIQYAEELASALQLAHSHHILHRDVNPKNVLLGKDGRARLVDFGLARYFVGPEEASSVSTQSSDITAAGSVAGTLPYMSPEQALGKSLDARSDVFSLGALFYEMCTGRRAFSGSQRAHILDAILNHEPIAIGRLNYEVPEEFERIIRKCLAKSRDERYPDTRDLLVDLRTLRRGGESGTSPRVAAAGREPRARLPRVALWAAGLALAAIITVVAMVSGPGWWKPDPGPRPGDAQVFYMRGMHYLDDTETEQSLKDASNLFNRAVERDPDFALAHAALGAAYWGRYRLTGNEVFKEEANREVAEAFRLAPDLPEAHNARGIGLLAEGEFVQAKEEFSKAVAAQPEMDRAWANIGAACRELGEYDEGLRAFRTAIRLRPDHFRHRIRLGIFSDRFSDLEAAEKAFRKAIELKPESWMAWSNLGAIHLKTGAFEEAVLDLLKAAAIEETGIVRSNLGTAYYFLGKHEEAIVHYRRATDLEPGQATHWANLGDALREIGEDEEARGAYRQAIPLAREVEERAPAKVQSHTKLGMYCARAGERDCALTEAGHLAGMDPGRAELAMGAAVIYCLVGQVGDALDALERAARLGISKSTIENDPDLSVLSDEPRFQRILRLAG